jgi:hypothetical protein
VADVGERAELPLEPVEVAAVGVAQQLERDVAAEPAVERAVDDARPAGAQRAADREAAVVERRSGRDASVSEIAPLVACAAANGL